MPKEAEDNEDEDEETDDEDDVTRTGFGDQDSGLEFGIRSAQRSIF